MVGVYFDGLDDRADIPPLGIGTSSATFVAWVRRDGSQTPWAGIVFSRSGNTTAGLNFGTADELRYHWNDDSSSWGFDSGLVVPNDEWVFCALVVEPSRATIYLGQGGSLSSAVNPISHAIEEFDGTTTLARDSGNRLFQGWLDDVRIYDVALTADQVDALFQSAP